MTIRQLIYDCYLSPAVTDHIRYYDLKTLWPSSRKSDYRYENRRYKQIYLNNSPYPHIEIDGLFNNFMLTLVEKSFPSMKKG